MTKRHDQPIRGLTAVAATGVLAAALTVGGAPQPAQAAIPDVARQWATLMYRSLTAEATVAQLRTTLAAQRTAVTTTAAGSTAAAAANTAAQTKLTAATAGNAGAHQRYVAANTALTAAKKTLAAVSAKKPRNNAAITRAKNAVAAAEKVLHLRAVQTGDAARVLKEALTGAHSATTGLAAANAAATAAVAAVRQTEQKIAGVGTAAGYAAQAAALGKDVVATVRPGFAVADTTAIYGVTVHQSVGYAFKRMVEAAKADGIALSGGGFRTKERQIELRKINGCPDVWTAPASSCRVPTAIPGRSLHEIGLAVDITSGGRTIGANTPAFKWLVVHAAAYGYVNLPSEAWHWSITGS